MAQILRLKDLVHIDKDAHGKIFVELASIAVDLMVRYDYFSINVEHTDNGIVIKMTDSEEVVIIMIDRWFGEYAMVVDAYMDAVDYMVVPLNELHDVPIVTVDEALSVGIPRNIMARYGLINIKHLWYDIVKVMKVGNSKVVPVKTIELGKHVKRYVLIHGRLECFELLE